MNIKYTLGSLISLPLLPIMYVQGKRIREKVPRLPEANGAEGESYSAEGAKTIRLLTIGESTIAGVGVDTHEEGFTGSLAKEISQHQGFHVKWKVFAKSGYTAKKVWQKILPKIEEEAVDLIVIGLGGNDAFTLNSPYKWRQEIKGIILELKNKYPRASIFFCNMPLIKEFPAFTPIIKFTIGNLVEILGDELAQICTEFEDVHFFSRKMSLEEWAKHLGVNGSSSDFFSDGVHPSKLTYQYWAKDMAGEIRLKNMIKV